jgi:hypothetical protein
MRDEGKGAVGVAAVAAAAVAVVAACSGIMSALLDGSQPNQKWIVKAICCRCSLSKTMRVSATIRVTPTRSGGATTIRINWT